MNLISNDERAAYRASIDDVHETMGRTITVWRQSSETIITQDENYDAFSDLGKSNVIYVTQSKEFKARIKYIDRQDKDFNIVVGNARIDIAQEFQLVRIKVNKEANDYIEDCERITFDDASFVPVTTPRPHGLFGNDYFTIYLKSPP